MRITLSGTFAVLLVITEAVLCAGTHCNGGTMSLYNSGEFGILYETGDMKCSWHLHARPGERVFITFSSFSSKSVVDALEIRDAVYPTHIIVNLSDYKTPPTVVSCGSSVIVTFNSTSSIRDHGFMAFFESKGYFTSGEFPNDYDNNLKQHWVICAHQNFPLCMRFTHFDTERKYDFVSISLSNGSTIGYYSGRHLPSMTIRTYKNTLMNFTSDYSIQRQGFRAEFCPSTCPKLYTPKNGYLNATLRVVNTNVRLACRKGYRPIGNTTALCQSSGSWSSLLGHCERTPCSPLPSVPNGFFMGKELYVGIEVRLMCMNGYYVAGGAKFGCSETGIWRDRHRMVCRAVSCGRPSVPQNVEVSGNFSFGNTVNFSCKEGYRLKGQSSATCLATGNWTQHSPTCKGPTGNSTFRQMNLIQKFQESFFDQFATYTKGALPPPGSVLRQATLSGFILALDLMFVLDTSGTVGRKGFNISKTFVLNTAKEFSMGKDLVHIGAIAYSTKAFIISPFIASYEGFRHAVEQFPYRGGSTNTTGALLEAKAIFLSTPRNMTRLKRVLILVTDGRSNTHRLPPEEVVPQLANNSIEIFVFGVGGRIGERAMQAIASPPAEQHFFHIKNFKSFQDFAEDLRPKNISYDCGIAGAPGFHTRVLNGKASVYGAWPWLASIYIKEYLSDDFKLSCGGTLVSDRWIITAAHCVYRYHNDKKRIIVKVGDYYRHLEDPYEEAFQLNEAEDIVFGDSNNSKSYDPWYNDNDIAIMKLNRTIKFNKYVRPVCLLKPIHHNSDKLTSPGSRATVVGWGYYEVNKSELALIPLQTTLSIMNNSVCSGKIGRTLTENMICAKGVNTDACPGDSGGPLMCQAEDNRFSLCGIVSFGKSESFHADGYGGYTRTFKFLDIIKSKITS